MGDISQTVYCLARIGPGGASLLGTAFALGNDKIATVAHVIEGNDHNLALILPRQKRIVDYQDAADDQVQHTPVEVHAIDPARDLCVLRLVDGHVTVGYSLSGTDALLPGMPAYVYGFPHANHGRMILTQDVAYVGARVLVPHPTGVKNKHVILNTFARPGQSGGPVFRADAPEVCAIVVGAYAPGGGGGLIIGGVDPLTLHQTTQAVSVEYLTRMLV